MPGVEIERKFLVRFVPHEKLNTAKMTHIIQSYLMNNQNGVVRVRIEDNRQAILTVKGPKNGLSCYESETEIPLQDALIMVSGASQKILKNRYSFEGWEIDQFFGNLWGLWIAERELKTEDEQFDFPSWLGEEISSDPRYYNSNLASRVNLEGLKL